jgi:hypothetical protein
MKSKCSSHAVCREPAGELVKYGAPNLLPNPDYTSTPAVGELRGQKSHHRVNMGGNKFANCSLHLRSLISPRASGQGGSGMGVLMKTPPWAIARWCPPCTEGDHGSHVRNWGLWPGLLGGVYCPCTGRCTQAVKDAVRRARRLAEGDTR